MIHFERTSEPAEFDSQVRQPGQTWLENHREGRPKDFWTPFKSDLADEFQNLCAYSAMYEPVGTVDHYLSCANPASRHLAYEWTNYRYASAWVNSSKKNVDDTVLDPFEVADDWFRLLLPSLQLVLIEENIPADRLQCAR